MPEFFELPSLGADMERGTVLQWYVEIGETVDRGSVVALVSTEKADVDVEIWQNGTIAEYLVEIGDEVPVGTPLLRLDSSVVVPAASPEPQSAAVVADQPSIAVVTEPAQPQAELVRPEAGRQILASPRARSLAAERGIDLSEVLGTGPDGAVLERDLGAPIVDKSTMPADSDDSTGKGDVQVRQAAMRQAIADRMAKANAEIPHYHLELDVDLGPTLDWLERHNRALDVSARVLPAALLLKATAEAARTVPELNGSWVDGRFEPSDGCDVAVVINLRKGGLVTPKISDAANKTVDEVMADLKEIVAGARRGSLRSSWMSGAGITVTNLGDNGADRVNGVIFPPQVALVGFGRIADRPFVVDSEVVPRPVLTVSLAADHRATDGSSGSRFLRALADQLRPANLALLSGIDAAEPREEPEKT